MDTIAGLIYIGTAGPTMSALTGVAWTVAAVAALALWAVLCWRMMNSDRK